MEFYYKAKRPTGKFLIEVGDSSVSENNLFTDLGMRQIYRPGKSQTISTSNGGIFKHCRIGNGSTPLTEGSTKLSNGIPLTSNLISTRLSYITEDGFRYAQGIFKYEFNGEYVGQITEIMLTGVASNSGMICGHTLDSPITSGRGDVIKVTYVVKIPIVSRVDNELDSGEIRDTTTGRTHQYTFSGRFHEETPTVLSTILPLESDWVITGNLSRMYINNSLLNDKQTRYRCEVVNSGSILQYDIRSAVMGNVGLINIVNANIANTDSSSNAVANYPFRLVFDPPMTKPDGLDWNVNFKINIDIGDL